MKRHTHLCLAYALLLIALLMTVGCWPMDHVRFTVDVQTDAVAAEPDGTDNLVEATKAVLRQRLDRADLTTFSMEREGPNRLIIDTYGARDVERLGRLLQQPGRLEFRLMPSESEVALSLEKMIDYFNIDSPAAPAVDTLDIAKLLETRRADTENPLNNHLLNLIQPVWRSLVFGRVIDADSAAFNALMKDPQAQALLPLETELLYSAKPVSVEENGPGIFEILAVNTTVELTGDVITDARVYYQDNQHVVDIEMNEEGTRLWARLTEAVVGKSIAIVMNGKVYTYPRVIGKVPAGRSQITGLETRAEAQDMAVLLNAGALPAPVELVAVTAFEQ